MWVLTPRGFYSVVAHHDEPDLVLVRARVREDLEALAQLIGPLEILATPDRDYAFRVMVSPEDWAAAAATLASEIDYPNFKDAVAERQGPARAHIYHRVWADLLSLQQR